MMSALDTQISGSHYQMPIQPVEFITKNKLTFLEGCIVKRVCRHRNKAGKEDLLKAIHELQLLIELEYPTSQPLPVSSHTNETLLVPESQLESASLNLCLSPGMPLSIDSPLGLQNAKRVLERQRKQDR